MENKIDPLSVNELAKLKIKLINLIDAVDDLEEDDYLQLDSYPLDHFSAGLRARLKEIDYRLNNISELNSLKEALEKFITNEENK